MNFPYFNQLLFCRNSNEQEAGFFLKEKFFRSGAYLPWNELIINSLNEPLNVRYYAEYYLKSN